MGQNIGTFTIIGDVIDAPSLGKLRLRQKCKIVVDGNTGMIKSMGEDVVEEGDIWTLSSNEFLIPGFIDIHCHAPQFPNSGLGSEAGLLEWLQKYTFPEESKYIDLAYAKEQYEKCVNSLVENGTTSCVYFATIHRESTKELCRISHAMGQRAYIGKVCMECNCPDFYKDESIGSAISDNMEIIEFIGGMQTTLVSPVITPRFAPVCSNEMMQQLSKISEEKSLLIQSHISETKDEVKWMTELFPRQSYAEVYDSVGLLTSRTIMAHAIHLSDKDLQLIKARRTAIAHCPTSNYALNSGILNVRRITNHGIKCGLGSDVSGGWTWSMLEVMRYALIASRSLYLQNSEFAVSEDIKPLTIAEVLYLATKGGAECILQGNLGTFEEGSYFDAIQVDCSIGNLRNVTSTRDSLFDRFQRFFFNGDDRNMKCVFVNGRRLK